MRLAQRPDPPPLETNDVRIVAAGAVLWGVALVVLVALDLAGADIHGWWIAMCAYGAGLGVPGVRFCRRRQAAIARERSAIQGSATPGSGG